MKRIDVNGVERTIPKEVGDVHQLLHHLGLENRILIVELNRQILNKDAYDHPIRDKDQIEIIHFVGGG
ncbi:sulfur transfer protein [Bacillus sp. OxB-1]|uniref:sulfur carrier protein ThiS n=1 Tax=Bacillus sp. (strain OxB-1) TaxID=98228 RepID=UPI000581EC15|nr:sulfur carrier protein ThiS [Bacillus sp. OxB-1]BAQ08631.1 sulfur transfer protein [Bacillus sp. OxB-1]